MLSPRTACNRSFKGICSDQKMARQLQQNPCGSKGFLGGTQFPLGRVRSRRDARPSRIDHHHQGRGAPEQQCSRDRGPHFALDLAPADGAACRGQPPPVATPGPPSFRPSDGTLSRQMLSGVSFFKRPTLGHQRRGKNRFRFFRPAKGRQQRDDEAGAEGAGQQQPHTSNAPACPTSAQPPEEERTVTSMIMPMRYHYQPLGCQQPYLPGGTGRTAQRLAGRGRGKSSPGTEDHLRSFPFE